jgi:ATP-dependent Clp protease ATP-binding subunit ClpA
MLQPFTDGARKAIAYAEAEVAKAGKMVISTEHILLGICHGEPSVASSVLSELGVKPEAIEAEIAKLEPDPVGKKPRTKVILSRDAKQAIEATYEELRDMKDSIVGTEHLLLGLIKQGGAASKILATLGVDIEKARNKVIAIPKKGDTDAPTE